MKIFYKYILCGSLSGLSVMCIGTFLMLDFWNSCIMAIFPVRTIGIHTAAWLFASLILILAFVVGKEWVLKEVK